MLEAWKVVVSQKARKTNHSEGGLTLIECLVAIVVIALATATVTPMMVFAVATRVQNQRAEQALQLAQGEIDKVRLVVEQGGDYGDRLKQLSLIAASASTTSAIQVAPPTAFVASTASVTDITQARKVDIDGDGNSDFAIQLFRTKGIELTPQIVGVVNSTPVVFEVGARVYDIQAERNLGSLQKAPADLTFTSGEGGRGRRPLAALYSQVAQGDREGSLCQYWQFAGTTPTNLQCN